MAKESVLKVVVAGELRDKGFKQADTAINKLAGSAKRLAGTLGLTFGTAAILGFAKASLKAFVEDDKAIAALSQTLKNLGLGYGAASNNVNTFISTLESQTGVLDDVLRPAFDRLVRATGNVTKAQDLLNLSLDIAAGTGKTVEQVSQSLQKAYLGQTQAIGRLGVGLSKAEITSSSFEQIQVRLTDLFSGQAATAADTYAGKMGRLAVAVNNVKENIGVGLVGALDGLSDSQDGLDSLISKMETVSSLAGDFVSLMFGGKTAGGFGLAELFDRELLLSNLKADKKIGFPKGGGGTLQFDGTKAEKDRIKAEKDRIKAEKDRLASIKKQADTEKKAALLKKANLLLSKASATFDLTKISIAAALKGKVDGETRLRLEAMQAIEEDNGELALELIGKLGILQKNNDLAKLAGIKTISDTALAAIDTNLLKEINMINQSKLSQEDKDKAIQAAFGRYNTSIATAGGLADAASYSERTQILQNLVLKEASIAKGTASAISATASLESAQLGAIGRVEKAQSAADLARQNSLNLYAAALAAIGAGAVIGKLPPSGGGGAGGGGGGAGGPFPISFTPPPSGGEAGGRFEGAPPSITINLSPGLVTDPAGVAALVADAVQVAVRNGYSLGSAGMLAI